MMQGKVACMKELGITECLRVKEQALISALIHNGRHRGFLLPNIALDAIRSSSEGNPPGTEDDEEQEAGDEGSRGEREREREREREEKGSGMEPSTMCHGAALVVIACCLHRRTRCACACGPEPRCN